MNRQEDLQIRDPAWLLTGAHDRPTGRQCVVVVVRVMTAHVGVNDVRAAVVPVMLLADVSVDERRGQRPCLKGDHQPDRNHAAQHAKAYSTDP